MHLKGIYIFSLFVFNSSLIYSFNLDFNELKQFLDKENSNLQSFDGYLSSEENRIFRLRQMSERFRKQNTIALKDKELFLSHPNDVYLLIKRITIEWKTTEKMLETNKLIFKQFSIGQNDYYNDAVYYFSQLINDYKLSVKSVVKGLIEYKTSSGEHKVFKSLSNQSFDSFDCFSIGKLYFNYEEYFSAKDWLEEGFNRTNNETSDELRADILQYLSLTEFQMGNTYNAKQYMNQSLNISTNKPLISLIIDNFDNLNKNKSKTLDIDEQDQMSNGTSEDNASEDGLFWDQIYERSDDLCLGRKLMNTWIESKLKCFYLNTTLRPYLRLTRIRVEELYKRPQIVLIHNFLSETEVQTLINISEPNLQPMKVIGENDEGVLDESRIAQGHFINDSSHPVTWPIIRRISEITGLNASDKSADRMNAIKYNVGGVYEVHPDSDEDIFIAPFGRILTWINYLSDVEAGGATILPKLNVSLVPEKYSAVFWYNHLSSGDIDDDMIHSGCPVLYGQKWIATKWIRIGGQPYDKCVLNRTEYKYLQ